MVPARDRAHADAQMRGEGLVAHPQRGLQRARGTPVQPVTTSMARRPQASRNDRAEAAPARAPGNPDARTRVNDPPHPAGLTAIGVLPVPLVARLRLL